VKIAVQAEEGLHAGLLHTTIFTTAGQQPN
jgi:hypothetical protein